MLSGSSEDSCARVQDVRVRVNELRSAKSKRRAEKFSTLFIELRRGPDLNSRTRGWRGVILLTPYRIVPPLPACVALPLSLTLTVRLDPNGSFCCK